MNIRWAKKDAPMSVAELRETLLGFPGDAPVVLFSDAEGNDVKPLLCVEITKAQVTVTKGYGAVELTKHALGSPAVFLTPYD
jgi:hypothetical protein